MMETDASGGHDNSDFSGAIEKPLRDLHIPALADHPNVAVRHRAKQVTSGDAKIAGRAVEVLDDDVKASFLAQFAEHNGYAPPPGTFELYTLDIAEISTLISG